MLLFSREPYMIVTICQAETPNIVFPVDMFCVLCILNGQYDLVQAFEGQGVVRGFFLESSFNRFVI